ncbi:hypothetical protein Droror1_Dr00015630 [Drosera rotundifolia]
MVEVDVLSIQGFILWLGSMDKHRTKKRLYKFGMIVDDICSLCRREAETRDHVFLKCPFVHEVIDGILPLIKLSKSPRGTWEEWLQWWCDPLFLPPEKKSAAGEEQCCRRETVSSERNSAAGYLTTRNDEPLPTRSKEKSEARSVELTCNEERRTHLRPLFLPLEKKSAAGEEQCCRRETVLSERNGAAGYPTTRNDEPLPAMSKEKSEARSVELTCDEERRTHLRVEERRRV